STMGMGRWMVRRRRGDEGDPYQAWNNASDQARSNVPHDPLELPLGPHTGSTQEGAHPASVPRSRTASLPTPSPSPTYCHPPPPPGCTLKACCTEFVFIGLLKVSVTVATGETFAAPCTGNWLVTTGSSGSMRPAATNILAELAGTAMAGMPSAAPVTVTVSLV